MTEEIWDCLVAALSEVIGITLLVAIVKFVSEYGIKKIGEAAGKQFLKRILKYIAKRAVPFGAILLILDIIYNVLKCYGVI